MIPYEISSAILEMLFGEYVFGTYNDKENFDIIMFITLLSAQCLLLVFDISGHDDEQFRITWTQMGQVEILGGM